MNRIKKRTEISEFLNYSFFNYLGVFIGVFSNLFIYTSNQEFLGTLRYVESLSFFVYPFILMGSSACLIYFSPKLNSSSSSLLFSYTLLSIFRNSIICILLSWFFVDYLEEFIDIQYLYFAISLAIFLAFIDLLKKQLLLFNVLALPTILDNTLPKIILPIIFILMYFNYINDYYYGISIYVFSFLCIVCFFYIYGSKFYRIKFNFQELFKSIDKKEYFKYSFFAMSGSLGYIFVFKLDTLMIPNLISFKANGIYSIATVAASVLYIPAKGLFSLYSPKVSYLLKNKEYNVLNVLYKDVSLSLLFIGLIIYGIFFLGIENIFSLFPAKQVLLDTVSVIYIIGLISVINMASGFNSEIINFSKFYKFNLIALTILSFLNLFFNYYFIIVLGYGIEGAACASLLSIFIFNSTKIIFIYLKLGLFPFDSVFLKLLILQVFILATFNLIPNHSNSIINLIIKCGGSLFLQLLIVYKLNWISVYNSTVRKFAAKYLKFF